MFSALANGSGAFKASAHYVDITGDPPPHYPPVMQEELTGKTVLLVGYGSIGKEIERMLVPFHVNLLRVARSARTEPLSIAVNLTWTVCFPRRGHNSDSALDARNALDSLAPQFALMQQGTLLVNAARGPIVNTDALSKP